MSDTFVQLKNDYLDKITSTSMDDIINSTVINKVDTELNTLGEGTLILAFFNVKAEFAKLNGSFNDAKKDFIDFSDSLQLDGKDIPDLLTTVVTYSEEAIKSFASGGKSREEILNFVDVIKETFVKTIDGFVQYVTDYIETSFAKCGPIKDVYDLVDNSLCYQLIQPFNGIWTGLGLYLIFMLPILILSCCLEPLFRRYDKTPAISRDRHIEMSGIYTS